MRHKSKVIDVFKRWKAIMENKTSTRVKKLQFDNGGEHKDCKFKKFCYENEIKLKKLVPETP